jgi:hypothetical protein
MRVTASEEAVTRTLADRTSRRLVIWLSLVRGARVRAAQAPGAVKEAPLLTVRSLTTTWFAASAALEFKVSWAWARTRHR